MAQEKSILKLKGMLDGMSFYKNQEGYHVRAKGGIEKERIMNDANFERTRENMNEFANINTAGKLLRNSISVFMNRAKDMRTGSRLVSIIAQVKNLDSVSDRGQRKFTIGIETPEGKALLEGFEFNKYAPLSTILKPAYEVDTDTGGFQIVGFYPKEHLEIPENASHVRFGFACVIIHPDTMKSSVKFAEQQLISINSEAADVALTLDSLPEGDGVKMFYVLVEYFQDLNGKQYPLKSGAFNALKLVRVV